MRILVVSNLYPPQFEGGYEIRCAQVAEALHQRGHEVRVLTSTHRVPSPVDEVIGGVPVRRALYQYAYPPYRNGWPWRLQHARDELADTRILKQEVEAFRPDVVNFWSLYGMAGTLAPVPRALRIPDVYWIEQGWLLDHAGYHREGARRFWTALWEGTWGPAVLRPLLRVAGRIAEARVRRGGLVTREFSGDPALVVFVSEFMAALHREGGLAFPASEVILGGVPTSHFLQQRPQAEPGAPLRLLYAGQLTRDRGLLTLLEALGRLPLPDRPRYRLTVAGGAGVDRFDVEAKQRCAALGLDGVVTFLGRVAHDAMPALYARHDVLVFPSERAEGLPLTMMEAMLAGCAVLTTASGGAAEIARRGDLPVFPPGDAGALAGLIQRFESDRELLAGVTARGQTVARVEFDFERMMDRFEAALARVSGRPR